MIKDANMAAARTEGSRRGRMIPFLVSVVLLSLMSGNSVYGMEPGLHSEGAFVASADSALVPAPPSRREKVALRTNVLLPLMNVGVEVLLGDNWIVEADWYYPWIRPEWLRNRVCVEALHASAGARYRLGKPSKDGRLTGHSVGLTLGWATYDFGMPKRFYRLLKQEVEGNWVMKGVQGWAVSASAVYVYSFPVGRRLRMEAGVALGAVYHQDVKYVQYDEGGRLLRDARMLEDRGWYFGPTGLFLNLIIPLGGVGR